MFLNVSLKTARSCLCMDLKNKQTVYVVQTEGDSTIWLENVEIWAFFCTNKQQKNMFSWVMCVCKWVKLEWVWARRNQIPWVHNLSVDEDAVVQQACGRIAWQCKSKSRELEGDGMTLTSQWTRWRRQTHAHIAFGNLSAAVFPGGRCTTHYLWLYCM